MDEREAREWAHDIIEALDRWMETGASNSAFKEGRREVAVDTIARALSAAAHTGARAALRQHEEAQSPFPALPWISKAP